MASVAIWPLLNPFTAALQTKLADIEADATTDQTAAEIVALLEALTGTGRLDASALQLIADAIDTELGNTTWRTGGGGTGTSTWLGLTDTPAAFGTAGQVSAVNTAEDGLEFVDQTGGGGGTDDQEASEVPVDATGFSGNLGSGDTDVQTALDTIDGFSLGGGGGGTAQALSRFEAVTTANTTAQALSATYADILEIATTDIFANVGAFTVATVSNISTITVPNNGLFKVTCHIKVATTGSARAVLYLRANVLRSGVAVANTATIMGGSYLRNFSNARTAILSGTTTLLLEAGDTITFQMAEEANTGSTYTIGGADSVVELVEIPSEAFAGRGWCPAGGTDTQILAKASDADYRHRMDRCTHGRGRWWNG